MCAFSTYGPHAIAGRPTSRPTSWFIHTYPYALPLVCTVLRRYGVGYSFSFRALRRVHLRDHFCRERPWEPIRSISIINITAPRRLPQKYPLIPIQDRYLNWNGERFVTVAMWGWMWYILSLPLHVEQDARCTSMKRGFFSKKTC